MSVRAAVLRANLWGRLSGPIQVLVAAVVALIVFANLPEGWLVVLLCCSVLALTAAIVRATRVAIETTPDSLVIRNPFRTVAVRWGDVSRVSHVRTQYVDSPRLWLESGRWVSVLALSGQSRETRETWVRASSEVVNDDPRATEVLQRLLDSR